MEENDYSVPSVDVENEMNHNSAPDRFLLCSGGINSVAMTHKMLEEVWTEDYHAWNKRPIVVFLDTTIGLSSQRLYVELLCDHYGWQLWKLRTHENFEEHTESGGFHGYSQHSSIFNLLKGRQLSKLTSVAGNPHLYFGSLIDEKGDHVQRFNFDDTIGAYTHNPLLNWTDEMCAEYLRDRGVPYNPNWESSHFTDCACGATASREELIELEAEGYEIFADKIRELEQEIERDDDRDMWAWQSFDVEEEDWMQDDDGLVRLACGGRDCSSASLKNTVKDEEDS